MVVFFNPTVLLLLCSTSALLVSGQYFRPYPAMAMDHGFSPYHPARINQETLPISQAEFAQLVAESMATSNGPHHHHPPNTDANYEGPEHSMRDAAMAHRGGRGAHNGYQPEEHHHHPQDHHESSHYQPEDHSDADHESPSYPRAPVYENNYDREQEEGPEEDDAYGGRPGGAGPASDGSGSDGPAYDNYDHPHNLHHQPGASHHGHEDGPEESRHRPIIQHYIPVANVPFSFV